MYPDYFAQFYPPSRSAALDYFRARADSSMIQEIGGADYGEDYERHFEALLPIWKEGRVEGYMDWYPREVLELIRWSEPENPNWKPGSPGERGHIMRGFACSALLIAEQIPENDGHFEGSNPTLIQLIHSARMIDREALACVGRFLTWRIPQLGYDDEPSFFAMGLLLTSILDGECELSEEIISATCDWIMETERKEREEAILREHGDHWLLGLTFYDLRHHKWKAICRECRDLCTDRKASELLERVLTGPWVPEEES